LDGLNINIIRHDDMVKKIDIIMAIIGCEYCIIISRGGIIIKSVFMQNLVYLEYWLWELKVFSEHIYIFGLQDQCFILNYLSFGV